MRALHLSLAIAILSAMQLCGSRREAQNNGPSENGHICAGSNCTRGVPLSRLPQSVRSNIRAVVVPEVKAIVDDRSMGLSGTNVNQVPLWIVQLTPGTSENMLFAVSWRDDSFGVDGPIWVVEAGKKGAVNLTPRENSSQIMGIRGEGSTKQDGSISSYSCRIESLLHVWPTRCYCTSSICMI
jgi:hypothetical protein